MLRRLVHLLLGLLLASPAGAAVCGVAAGKVAVAAVEARGEIVLEDGRRARLAGLSLAPGAESALSGRRFSLALLNRRPDRWGRLLVDLADENGQSVALALLVAGLARVAPEFETRACESERLEAEGAARAAGEGLWSSAGAILDAADRGALEASDGRFVLVAGFVRRVGERRVKVYLDFAGRGALSVTVARNNESLLRRRGIDPRTLAGKRLLVRGVLDDRFGPRIEVADPSMIELQEGAGGAKETKRAE
jgi:hypothetical protein